MQAWHYGLASPPIEYNRPDTLDCSQTSDSDSDCSSSATLASTASSLSTLASAASTSMWSAPSSQHSDSTPISVTACGSDSCGESQNASQHKRFVTGKQFGNLVRSVSGFQQPPLQLSHTREEVPPELRKNLRRTSASSSASRGCPPTLFRQVDRKVEFVDKLVDSATYIVEAIWPTSSVPCRNDFGTSTSGLPLRKFIEETLRRSRTSYSTLQVGLYYLILIKPHIPSHDFTMEQTDESHASRALQCGRRMFLAALILASKWLQDRNYSARAWSKISGLKISEINENELAFLAAVNWKLHISEGLYNTWNDCVMKHTPSLPPSPGSSTAKDRCWERECAAFKKLIRRLTPGLDNVEDVLPVAVKEKRRAVTRFTSIPKSGTCLYPSIMEPVPAAVCSPGRQVPALGLLPTPHRLASQPGSGFSTPAVSAASQLIGRAYSMSTAMSHATAVCAAHNLDRWPVPVPSFNRTSSPSYAPTRRSSLANTVSTASSPESMVSDSSGNSRSSSISSVSLLHNAPAHMQARRGFAERPKMLWNGQQFRFGQLAYDGPTRKSSLSDMVDIIEPYSPNDTATQISSPETYNTYPQRDDILHMSSKQEVDADKVFHLSVRDAAFALQELHNHRDVDQQTPQPTHTWSAAANQGSKRKRPTSTEDSVLQESVRGLLAVQPECGSTMWSDKIAGVPIAQTSYPTPSSDGDYAWSLRGSVDATEHGVCKRVRRSVPGMYQAHLHEAYAQHRLIPSM